MSIKSKKSFRYFLCAGLAAAVLTIFSGCGMRTEARLRRAETALQKKYGEEFTATRYIGQDFLHGYYSVEAYSRKHPDILFEASLNTDGCRVNDTYVSKRVCRKLSDRIAEGFVNHSESCFVHTEELNEYSFSNNPEISVEEYLAEYPEANFLIYLHYVPKAGEDPDRTAADIAEIIDTCGIINGKLAVFITDQETIEEAKKYVLCNVSLGDDYQRIVDPSYAGTVDIKNSRLEWTDVARILLHASVQSPP